MRTVARASCGLLLALPLFALVACGGGGLNGPNANSETSATSATGVSVTIYPGTVTLSPGQTFQFTASVHGAAGGSLTWGTNGGTIDQSGKYTAPAATSTGQGTTGNYVVSVNSSVDPSVAAECRVTVPMP